MQKHDVKNATGTSATQQPAKKIDTKLDDKKSMPKQVPSDRSVRTDEDLKSGNHRNK